MLSVKADRPVDPLTLAVMREVDALARQMKLTYFVCGAAARDIVLQHVYGIETGRATADVDFAIAVENWEQFDSMHPTGCAPPFLGGEGDGREAASAIENTLQPPEGFSFRAPR